MNHSDLEELLEEKPVERTWGFPKRVAVVLGAVGLVALALFSVGRAGGLRRTRGHYVGLEEVSCFEVGMYYTEPVKLSGSERTVELTADLCQQRCQVVEGGEWREVEI